MNHAQSRIHVGNSRSFRSPLLCHCGVDKSSPHWGNILGKLWRNKSCFPSFHILAVIRPVILRSRDLARSCKAKWVLVVEKDSVFQHVLHSGLLQLHPLILVTGRGYPDILTRRFLQKLQRIAPQLPQLYLGDFEARCAEGEQRNHEKPMVVPPQII